MPLWIMAYGGKSINANGSFKSKNVYKLRKIKHIYLENFPAIYNLKLPPSLLSWNLLTCVVIQATIICRFHCFTRVKRLGTLKKQQQQQYDLYPQRTRHLSNIHVSFFDCVAEVYSKSQNN